MAANPNTSGNVRQLLTDLEDVLTEEVLSSDVLTGDYYISDVNEGSKKVTEITLYANTKGKMQRKNAVKSFLGVVGVISRVSYFGHWPWREAQTPLTISFLPFLECRLVPQAIQPPPECWLIPSCT